MSVTASLGAGDFLFYALALAALAGAAASALRASLAASAQAAMASAVALALLWARIGAPGAAALEFALVAVTGAVLLLAPATTRGDEGDRARLLRAAAMPVAAWLVLALRVMLMTSWPVQGEAAVRAFAVPGLLHHLVLALLLLALALLSAASRRSLRGVAIAAASAGSAVATALVALSHFTSAGLAAAQLGALAAASSWIAAALAMAAAGDEQERGEGTPAFATGLSTAVAAVALALLAGTW